MTDRIYETNTNVSKASPKTTDSYTQDKQV